MLRVQSSALYAPCQAPVNMLTEREIVTGMDDELKAAIAARLDRLLDENERSAAAIAKSLGRSRQWLTNLRKGTNMVRTVDIPPLVRILGCSADELLGLQPPTAPAFNGKGLPVQWQCPHCGTTLTTTVTEG